MIVRNRRAWARAFTRSASRGFAPGHAWEDWQAAEREGDGFPVEPVGLGESR